MIKVATPMLGDEEYEVAVEVLKSGMYTSGKRVRAFEEAFAKYIGVKYAVACNSGTAALHMALLALQDKDEYAEVIVPPMSFFATISSVIMSGMVPHFVDVKPDCNIDEDQIEDAINMHTKAIMPVHFFGKPCDMEKIMKIARRHQLDVIEDCAQAHGAHLQGKKVGSFGTCGCFSFFATKNMTTIEGGMITTDRSDVYEKCLLLRSHGMTDRDTHSVIGYNYRMNELSGAIGLIQLNKLDGLNDKRISNSQYLFANIYNSFGCGELIDEQIVDGHVYFWYPVRARYSVNASAVFKDYLKDNGIGFRQRYIEPLNKQPVLKGRYSHYRMPVAERMSGNVIGLPNHPGMTQDELDRVVEVVNSYDPIRESVPNPTDSSSF
jgi:dTDP-4-amino-4,6-dideoxygalactose transaminase